MSIDKSLRKRGALARARNVLKRHERIEKMKDMEIWNDDRSPFNLPKTRVNKVVTKKAAPKKAAAEAAGAAGAAPAAEAAKPAAKGGGKK
jgi:small basic protein (TIGR04137 family)